MKVKMYKAVDAIDKEESLFAVCGDKMAVSTYFGKDDPWLSEDGFGDFNSYDIEDHDESIMINPVLVWGMNYKENPIATTLACMALGLFFGGLIGWCI